MRDLLAAAAVGLAERGLPDAVVRAGMRRAIAGRLRREAELPDSALDARIAEWHRGPIALVPDEANRQHYEVPASFFRLVLGPWMKYSACLWPEGVADLADAEEAMLAETVRAAGLEDGMTILDLGCGWGSLSLWMAERFPSARVVAVSNSASQGRHIAAEAAGRGLANVEHRVGDVNDVDPGGGFDAVVSVEMMEHVRNHPLLLERIASWLRPGGALFVHVFAHRDRCWPFEDDGPGDWMARTFFTGGIMPSHDYFTRFASPFEPETSTWIDGTHYRRTLDAWLSRLDGARAEVGAALAPVYGGDTDRWVQRWRMFFMACSEFFGVDGGSTVGVSHHRFRLA